MIPGACRRSTTLPASPSASTKCVPVRPVIIQSAPLVQFQPAIGTAQQGRQAITGKRRAILNEKRGDRNWGNGMMMEIEQKIHGTRRGNDKKKCGMQASPQKECKVGEAKNAGTPHFWPPSLSVHPVRPTFPLTFPCFSPRRRFSLFLAPSYGGRLASGEAFLTLSLRVQPSGPLVRG